MRNLFVINGEASDWKSPIANPQSPTNHQSPITKNSMFWDLGIGILLVIWICGLVIIQGSPLVSAASVLQQPPSDWTLEESNTMYLRLYDSSDEILDLGAFFSGKPDEVLPVDLDDNGNIESWEERDSHWIADRAISAVAADLVVQFYKKGTYPLYSKGTDLVVWRTNDLEEIPPESLDIRDERGEELFFQEAKLWVRDAVFGSPEKMCQRQAWWFAPSPEDIETLEISDDGIKFFPECVVFVREIKRAVEHERELHALRQDLSLIAYGEEFIWDGQLEGGPSDLRTYDLLLDIAAAGNILGSAQFQLLFDQGNQGEQCDSDKCRSCILPVPHLCGDGGVQGAEQCDDGNRLAGDGCDEFCQIEGNYCGNENSEYWEYCDEGKECPNGDPCETYSDCQIGGVDSHWERTCRYSGNTCDFDNDCSCPDYIERHLCDEWQKNSCRFVLDGVCKVGEMVEGTVCSGQAECKEKAVCNNSGYCEAPNDPYDNIYRRCRIDEDCTSCSLEEVWGTCYATGDECTGNEDCPQSDYCMLNTENICRPRTKGGYGGDSNSECNEYCEDITRCGDRVTYLDENGAVEECDDGMQCDNGAQCSRGQWCKDGSFCQPRNGARGTSLSCTGECKIQLCGDGEHETQSPEECDTGSKCIDLSTVCTIKKGYECIGMGVCSRKNPDGDPVYCGTGYGACPESPDPDHPNICNLNESCGPRNEDEGECSAICIKEECGDRIIQESLNEECDDGNTEDDDGCSSNCETENSCGNGQIDGFETCDDGNNEGGDGCSAVCTSESPFIDGYCGDGILQEELGEECEYSGKCVVFNEDSGSYEPVGDSCDIHDPNSCDESLPTVCSASGGACESDADCGSETCVQTRYWSISGILCTAYSLLSSGSYGDCLSGSPCVADFCGECNEHCKVPACGNEVTDCNEECDGGERCTDECKWKYCGDGITQEELDEECDDAELNSDVSSGACRTSCLNARCGDSVIDSNEQCDDGNDFGGDGCSSSCGLEYCGDGIVQWESGEQCDMGGDGCGQNCQPDFYLCGNGVIDPEGGDTEFATDDDEECDFADTSAGICPDGNSCDAEGGELCDLGECNLRERRCLDGNVVCASDADCQTPCINECTQYCKVRSIPCGDGYRDNNEQCDDGNKESGDGCSFYCELERLDLCGNGVVDRGEECDQGHPYNTAECNPYCQRPHPAPMCGDGRKDPSGSKRGNVLDELTTFSRGYRLDWRVPDGEQMQLSGQGGWYMTPRVFDRKLETPFERSYNRGLENEVEDELDQRTCSLCGDGTLDEDEQCDSGRLSGGSYPVQRVNYPGWRRAIYGMSYARYFSPYYWRTYWGVYPFGHYSQYNNYDLFNRYRYFNRRGWWGNYWSLLSGETRWPSKSMPADENRVFVKENCNSACRLQLCGNDRIDPGETCDDQNVEYYGSPQDGDGCSDECFLESGFVFSAPAECGDDVVSLGEQCDIGGRCVRADGEITSKYCRFEHGRFGSFCNLYGEDDVINTPDDETCEVVNGDGCDKNCQIEPIAICGNGRLEPYEECDDGLHCMDGSSCEEVDGCEDIGDGSCMRRNGDRCSDTCRIEPSICGNETVEFGEQCDGQDGCSSICTYVSAGTCGNGIREAHEQCDDGNNDNGDGCSANCFRPYCGDGVIDRGEECELNEENCFNCILNLCGNGRIDSGETCDDGNGMPGDGCSGWCLIENVCGNANLDGGEICDDGNDFDGDGCSSVCLFEFCGDGVTQYGLGEECDDGNQNNFDGCRNTCQLPVCGDGRSDDTVLPNGLRYREVCDPGKHCSNDPNKSCEDDYHCSLGPCDVQSGRCVGNQSIACEEDLDCGYGDCRVMDTDSCTAECAKPVRELPSPELCGDGVIDTGEECDDGNRAGHDGCTENCILESAICDGGSCSRDMFVCEDGSSCNMGNGCREGVCKLRRECATQCVFGLCGDEYIDPGESCDNGRHCEDDSSKQCWSHSDCETLCVPMSNDGCSSACKLERYLKNSRASLTLCQEEILGESGGASYGSRIGSDQIDEWKETILDPARNPFVQWNYWQGSRYLGTRGGAWWSNNWEWWNRSAYNTYSRYAYPWHWGSSWWPRSWHRGWYGYYGGWRGWWSRWHSQCTSGKFPNSAGNLVQSVAGCLDKVSKTDAMPDRDRIMPFQPAGAMSYMACQEPRAQLVSAVAIPSVPPIDIPEYNPSELVRDLERYVCSLSGFPRRSFLFLCKESVSPYERIKLSPPFPDVSNAGILTLPQYQKDRTTGIQSLLFTHILDVGYRAGDTVLSQYFKEAFTALSAYIDTAINLMKDLRRTNFTDDVCPIGPDESFCVLPQ
jgi:cysteine-rich repeat protein